ncbi:MAG: DUF288 domain-containing protein [Rhodothermales bacterium]|nr:DUF288 domain-containing protein [Rhodothermales bacterium]MBO6780068.1 DUF288 domain-containing protein [Rhodothermales bacterium]
MRFIAITSIFPPTEAVRLFAGRDSHALIVAGDRKSPDTWECAGAEFLDVQTQLDSGFRLASLLPFNHYCRKLIAYLTAVRRGATEIVDTDDDNLPYDDWSFPAFDAAYPTIGAQGYVNVYRRYTTAPIWPRGFPLSLITESLQTPPETSAESPCNVGIWQGLADEDPDVDAVYRLTDDTPVTFAKAGPVVLESGAMCPFNSQNTAFRPEAFPLLYLPSTVTFRFTDILRGIVAQPILWAAGLQLGFLDATVRQVRNPHDYMADFRSEVPMYLHGEQAFDIARSTASSSFSVADNLHRVYEALHTADIVQTEEITRLEAWLGDLTG